MVGKFYTAFLNKIVRLCSSVDILLAWMAVGNDVSSYFQYLFLETAAAVLAKH